MQARLENRAERRRIFLFSRGRYLFLVVRISFWDVVEIENEMRASCDIINVLWPRS